LSHSVATDWPNGSLAPSRTSAGRRSSSAWTRRRSRQLATGLGALGSANASIGFARDGGYWGIGLRMPDRAVFAGVPMSAADTGAIQLARLLSLGLQPARLAALRDVDLFSDASAVAAQAPRGRFAAALAAIEPAVAARRKVAA
jgi:hypothetical protein